jgi:hypothetical protein
MHSRAGNHGFVNAGEFSAGHQTPKESNPAHRSAPHATRERNQLLPAEWIAESAARASLCTWYPVVK